MTKSKKRDKDKLSLSEENFLTLADRNLELINQNKELTEKLEAIKTDSNPYLIKIKMYTDRETRVWDFTPVIQLIQFESPELLVRILRTVHHQYSCLNLAEMATALNKHKPSINDYSEKIPNELYILKELADCIENIKST